MSLEPLLFGDLFYYPGGTRKLALLERRGPFLVLSRLEPPVVKTVPSEDQARKVCKAWLDEENAQLDAAEKRLPVFAPASTWDLLGIQTAGLPKAIQGIPTETAREAMKTWLPPLTLEKDPEQNLTKKETTMPAPASPILNMLQKKGYRNWADVAEKTGLLEQSLTQHNNRKLPRIHHAIADLLGTSVYALWPQFYPVPAPATPSAAPSAALPHRAEEAEESVSEKDVKVDVKECVKEEPDWDKIAETLLETPVQLEEDCPESSASSSPFRLAEEKEAWEKRLKEIQALADFRERENTQLQAYTEDLEKKLGELAFQLEKKAGQEEALRACQLEIKGYLNHFEEIAKACGKEGLAPASIPDAVWKLFQENASLTVANIESEKRKKEAGDKFLEMRLQIDSLYAEKRLLETELQERKQEALFSCADLRKLGRMLCPSLDWKLFPDQALPAALQVALALT